MQSGLMTVTSDWIKFAGRVGITAGVTLFLASEVGTVAKVEGNSMQPSFNPRCGHRNEDLRNIQSMSRGELKRELLTRLRQDRVVLDKVSAGGDRSKLRVGDVVILTSPKNPSGTLIKRIAALPGDTIRINDTGDIELIDEGHCWVTGDNQQSSYDSNNFGQVPLGLIRGRVLFIIWPPNRIGKVSCDPSMLSSSTMLLSQTSS